ncbi:hypothetical protein AWC38_SpisGene14202, partial [Stylophora pistillata]
ITAPNDKVSSGETQPFESEPFIQRGSGEGQNPDPEATANWASNELEFDASGSGKQEEMERESKTSVCKPPPGSNIRWTGLSLAYTKSNDEIRSANKGKDKKEEQKEGGLSIIATTFVAAGVFLLLMMISFFVFTWPIRKYYEYLYTSTRNADAETGKSGGEELTSVRVDSSYPPEDDYQEGYYYYYYPLEEPMPGPSQTPDIVSMFEIYFKVTPPNDKVGSGETQLFEPELFVRRKTGEGQNPDPESITNWAFNEHEYDASGSAGEQEEMEQPNNYGDWGIDTTEQFYSGSEFGHYLKSAWLPHIKTEKDVQWSSVAPRVIVPKWDHKESLKKSKEKCQEIKNRFCGKRRPSLTEEIEVAKAIILDSEMLKYEFPAAVVEERLILCREDEYSSTYKARCGQQSNEHLTTRNVEGATHQHEERKAADVMANDKKRDSRNFETRKLIKEQSSQRRNSLVDSIIIAKSIIGDCAKNKTFEKKASQRRHIIKECCLGPESDKGLNKKRVSFADELETACSVIAPDSPYRERLQHSKEKRRAIKEKTSGKRRASLSDDIEIAKSIILESPKRYTLPLNLVQEGTYTENDFEEPQSLAESDDGTASVDTSADKCELDETISEDRSPDNAKPSVP